jgi:hypothetical protein
VAADPILRATNEAGDTYDDPSEDLLFELLGELGDGNSFLIVDRLEPGRTEDFIQTVIGADGSFVLEYREGSKENHHRTKIDCMRTVHAVMTKWAFDLPGWRDDLVWTPVRY